MKTGEIQLDASQAAAAASLGYSAPQAQHKVLQAQHAARATA